MSEPMGAKEWRIHTFSDFRLEHGGENWTDADVDAYAAYCVREFAERAAHEWEVKHGFDKHGVAKFIRVLAGKE